LLKSNRKLTEKSSKNMMSEKIGVHKVLSPPITETPIELRIQD